MATKILDRKPLTLAERTYLPQIAAGLWVTFRKMFGRRVTLEYPEQKPQIPRGYRGVPTLVKDPNGREKCVSCQLCEFVCPPKAIRITPGEIPADSASAHVEKAPKDFELNMLRCIYCGLCEEACPERAIVLQNVYSLNAATREEVVLHKDKLYELGGTLPDKIMKWDKKKAAADKAAGSHH
jgi:NADH-quinone oxidoreductase subunit I